MSVRQVDIRASLKWTGLTGLETNYPLTVSEVCSSSTDNSANLTEKGAALVVTDLRRKTHDVSDDGGTTESSPLETDECESERDARGV